MDPNNPYSIRLLFKAKYLGISAPLPCLVWAGRIMGQLIPSSVCRGGRKVIEQPTRSSSRLSLNF